MNINNQVSIYKKQCMNISNVYIGNIDDNTNAATSFRYMLEGGNEEV